jgi:transcriptional regulator with PAS, ATPase and Fis domain
MRAVREVLDRVAPKDVTVTLIGESGTGKEILARRVHELSPRRSRPFVPINCAAIPESLFESELFGHERGAFTGANERAIGKVEAANGGTLFLDEIGELPLAMQAKILRYLEGRRFMRVGGHTKIDSDVRLVCATLRPLDREVEAGRFRADLYYRIQGITLVVPPLRERPGEIAALTDQFTAEMCARHAVEAPRYPRAVRQAFARHPWPGNVRELRNVVENLCLLRSGATVRLSDLPFLAPAADPAAETITLRLDQPLRAMEERILLAVLAREGGHQQRAAERLGISTRTLQRRLGELGAARPRE